MNVCEIYSVLKQHYADVIAYLEKENLIGGYISLESVKTIVYHINTKTNNRIFIYNKKDAKFMARKKKLPKGDCWLVYSLNNPISNSVSAEILNGIYGIVGIKIY